MQVNKFLIVPDLLIRPEASGVLQLHSFTNCGWASITISFFLLGQPYPFLKHLITHTLLFDFFIPRLMHLLTCPRFYHFLIYFSLLLELTGKTDLRFHHNGPDIWCQQLANNNTWKWSSVQIDPLYGCAQH